MSMAVQTTATLVPKAHSKTLLRRSALALKYPSNVPTRMNTLLVNTPASQNKAARRPSNMMTGNTTTTVHTIAGELMPPV